MPRRSLNDMDVELAVGGMTCTSCAARVERRLNRLPGVNATVNFATETATVMLPEGLTAADAIRAVEETGYTATTVRESAGPEAEIRSLRRRLVVCGAFAVPVIVVSMVPATQFTGWPWLALALTTPIVVWGAWPFHRAAGLNARHRAATMDTLISMGVLAAYLWSVWALVIMGSTGHGGPGPALYFEVAAAVPVFILAGRYFEVVSKYRSTSALRALMDLSVPEVTVVRDGTQVQISTDEISVGDVYIVKPGMRLAADGVVVDGAGAVDQSLLTGESLPVDVATGSVVHGGTVNVDGRLCIRATRVGGDTRLAQVARLVAAAQAEKAPVQRLADRISAVFVPLVIVISLATLVGWLVFSGDVQRAFTAAVAVLIIACPCALGLATPIALLVGTGRGAQLGVLIRGPSVLEDTRRITTIVLDKTGTVTTGQMRVIDIVVPDAAAADAGERRRQVLVHAAAVEAASEHPIARAIVAAADGPVPTAEGFANVRGRGAHALVEAVPTFVGRPAFVEEQTGDLMPTALQAAADDAAQRGASLVAVGWGGGIRGLILVADTIRPTSQAAVEALAGLGLEPVLLTGDHVGAAREVASRVGIARVIADVAPEDKVRVVQELQVGTAVVAMVGDGVNDAAALAAADLGIAMGSGSDVAIEASDLTLTRPDLLAAVDAIALSRRTLATIKGNLFWAFAYNVAMIPLAAAGLLNPMLAGAAMAFSSVFVVANSLRLRRFVPAARL